VTAARELAVTAGKAAACRALGVSRATLYRRGEERPEPALKLVRPASPRRLSEEERQAVLEILHGERFVDKAPATVHATLLDEGTYLCSERTMYRLLESAGEVRERRDQLRHPPAPKPQLVATAPNQVWSWDITKLLGPSPRVLFYLYVVLDIFSRYVVGWMLARREGADLAERLLRESFARQGIVEGQLTVHSDRGPAMVAQSLAQFLTAIGVGKSHGRPRVSDDNAFSESQFKTVKYQPDFPDRFGSYEDALGYCRQLFPWYNDEHRHSGIAMLTPADVHYGRAQEVLAARQRVLEAAYESHPERFVHGLPEPPRLPQEVWINPPARRDGHGDLLPPVGREEVAQ
jgi:putative transposase